MLQDRISSARGYLERYACDVLLFIDLNNIRYLTGFTGSDGAFVLAGNRGCFLTDSRYVTQAAGEVTAFETAEYRVKLDGICEALKKIGARKVGFAADHTTVAQLTSLAAALPELEFKPIGTDLDDLRIIKEQGEVELLDRCAEIASLALLATLDRIRPGAVERDVALSLEFAMRESGADDKSFDFIVASGVRGALPHGKASSKQICAGELVTLDFGAVYRGYHSDETVTVSLGRPNDRQREIYSIVKDAHDRALEAVRPGVSCRDLDGIARGYIDSKGYGGFFGHGLGHGVGLEVHERPVISPRSDSVLEEGMVCTIEPGIYIPDWGGVRIEDTVLVTGCGCRVLTRVSKDLLIL